MLSLDVKIIEVKQETPDVKSFKLDLDGQRFDYKPAQFVYFSINAENVGSDSRPLSIASSPTEDFIMLSTKISNSDFKQRLNGIKTGDLVTIKGPIGTFILKEDAKEIVMLGGGIGITPFRDMIKYATDKKLPINITLIYSNRTPADIVYKDEWPVFEKENPNLKVVHTITDAPDSSWKGRTGRINDSMVKEYCNDLHKALFYICGPPGMVNAIFEILIGMGVPGPNIKLERFAGY